MNSLPKPNPTIAMLVFSRFTLDSLLSLIPGRGAVLIRQGECHVLVARLRSLFAAASARNHHVFPAVHLVDRRSCDSGCRQIGLPQQFTRFLVKCPDLFISRSG